MATKLMIVGAAGRMGRRIVALASEGGGFEIAAAVDRAGHPDIGKDAGLVAGVGGLDVELGDSYAGQADVAIDFSLPQAAPRTVNYCVENGAALVMGTTGLGEAERAGIEEAAAKIPVIYGTNMSVGMNVLFELVGRVAGMLGAEYDVEIVEEHHRFKKDAPSGSALTLARRICDATGRKFPEALVHGRSGTDALRKKGRIGMHAVRAGDIVGVHSVVFGTLGETVTLNHRANSRDTFVRGALRAAGWLAGKKPGSYSMADVLAIA